MLILLGAPGSGKGTQASRLARDLGVPHISTGDLFRQHMKEQTELGKKVTAVMNAGELVSDDLVFAMLKERISQGDCQLGYILDGFPRTMPQAEALEPVVEGEKLYVINLDVSLDLIVERVTGRLVCGGCGNIQHRTYSPPRKEGVCDVCGGTLAQRRDDTEEVVKARLDAYQKQTAPLLQFYQERGLLEDVDGEKKPEEVFAQLFDKLSVS